jgi:predicted signal transduction protein with EAL and GGDEF domain
VCGTIRLKVGGIRCRLLVGCRKAISDGLTIAAHTCPQRSKLRTPVALKPGVSRIVPMAPIRCYGRIGPMKDADLALYPAKNEGCGTYRFFEQAMDERMQHRCNLEIGCAARWRWANSRWCISPKPFCD